MPLCHKRRPLCLLPLPLCCFALHRKSTSLRERDVTAEVARCYCCHCRGMVSSTGCCLSRFRSALDQNSSKNSDAEDAKRGRTFPGSPLRSPLCPGPAVTSPDKICLTLGHGHAKLPAGLLQVYGVLRGDKLEEVQNASKFVLILLNEVSELPFSGWKFEINSNIGLNCKYLCVSQ